MRYDTNMHLGSIHIAAIVAIAVLGAVTFLQLLDDSPAAFHNETPVTESTSYQQLVPLEGSDTSNLPLLAPSGEGKHLLEQQIREITPLPSDSEQKIALKKYGNNVGGAIIAHFDRQPNQLDAINQFLSDHSNPSNRARIDALAADLEKLAQDISTISPVPPLVESAHIRVRETYPQLAAALRSIARAENETDMFQAMQYYNKTLDTLTSTLTSISQVFAVVGVAFGGSEPGNLFNAQ